MQVPSRLRRSLYRRVAVLLAVLALCLPVAAQDVKRPKILGVAHMAVGVTDIEKSRAFYKDFLGYSEPFDIKKPDGSLEVAFIKINDLQYVELFPGLDPANDRLKHIALYTDDIEGLRKYLASKDVKVPAKATKGRSGNLSFTVNDPDGHEVEMVQYMPDGWAMSNKGKAMTDARLSPRMLHVGIIVGNVAKAMAFYHDILGFNEFWRGSSRNSETLSWINMRVPDGTDYVEFMLYDKEPAPTQRGSQHHICLEIPDAQKAVDAINARPNRKDYTRDIEIRTGINRKRQVNLFDPDGTRVEVMEGNTVDGKPAESSKLPPPRG